MKKEARGTSDVVNDNESISVYNKAMGGVDRMDQNIGAYMINIRSKKWWWPLFRFCVDLAVNNALTYAVTLSFTATPTRRKTS